MKKWLIYVLGIITGVILTFAFAFCVNLSNNSGIIGLEMFEEPGDYMEHSQFEVFQVVESGCALAHADDSFGAIVFIIPNEKQQFYDDQKIGGKTLSNYTEPLTTSRKFFRMFPSFIHYYLVPPIIYSF
jgi:hypothetical protein